MYLTIGSSLEPLEKETLNVPSLHVTFCQCNETIIWTQQTFAQLMRFCAIMPLVFPKSLIILLLRDLLSVL